MQCIAGKFQLPLSSRSEADKQGPAARGLARLEFPLPQFLGEWAWAVKNLGLAGLDVLPISLARLKR